MSNTDKKYELVAGDTIKIDGTKLYRIRALYDFSDVKKGEWGGYVQSEDNLSHEGYCWVYDDAKVYNNAIIHDDARIFDYACVHDNAMIYNNVMINDHATVSYYSSVFDDIIIQNKSIVTDGAVLHGDVMVTGNAEIRYITMARYGRFGKYAYIRTNRDYVVIGPIGSRDDYTTFYRTKVNDIYVCCGCFNNSLEKFEKTVKETHGDNEYAKEYMKAIEMAKSRLA